MMHNEPRIVPVTPGQVLVRLSEILGTTKLKPQIVELFPEGAAQNLDATRLTLLSAIESGNREQRRNAFENAQRLLMQIYEAVAQAVSQAEKGNDEVFAALGFPNPAWQKGAVQAVDVSTVLATFAQPERQVFMNLSFDDAPGAVAYWLRETRVIAGEDVDDYLIENYAPVFQRVRLAEGPHRFRIESRNLHAFTLSDEFTVEIPART